VIQIDQNMGPLLADQNTIMKLRFPQIVNFLPCWTITAFTRSRFCDPFEDED